MAGTKLVTTAVLLLLFWSTHQVIAQDPLTVSITVDHTDPPGFTPENPSDYRAASGSVAVTCTATGGTGDGPTYQWSSTCKGCEFRSRTNTVITRPALHSGDNGTHTCTATRGGESVMDSIVINIVGAGIHVFNGELPVGSQPNNGLVRPFVTTSTYRLRFFCRSDSTVRNLGELIGPGGTAITTNAVFEITTNSANGGELVVFNFVSSDDVTSSEQGVYTCRIPQQSGVMRDINIGIYPSAFNSVPTITNPLEFTQGSPSSTLTCTSTTSIATTVTFMRDGKAINGIVRDGDSATTYQLSQTMTDRIQSTYDNVLTINEALSSLAGSTFTCQVANALGMSAISDSFQIPDPLTVSITVDRTDPPGFTPENPTDYRAASGPQIVTCTAKGGSGSGDYDYEWTSTCSRCDFQRTSTGVTSVIDRTAVHSRDIGTHTCTASRGGDSASDSIVFNVVGAGFHVFNGASRGSQPNNGLVVLTDIESRFRTRFFCRSDSLTFNVGELIGLDGNTFSGNDYLAFQTPSNGGELGIENVVGSEQPLPASEQGIYTCRIPLQSGEIVMINIGVYPIEFNFGPTVSDPLLFTLRSPSTITCISTGSPATTVTFMRGSTTVGPLRDEESVFVDGVTYDLAQTVTNRRESTYENVLTINDALANLADDTFTCTVVNTLGMDTSLSITIIAIMTSISPQTVTVGDTVTFTCTSALGPAMIQWEDRDNGDMILEMTSGMQTELALELGPISQSMDGRRYRCRVVIDGDTILDTVTLTIEAPSVTAAIAVSSATDVGGRVTLTCDVTGLRSLASDTTITFSGSRAVTGTGSTSLQLLLDPALLSDAGQYTCMATVTSSLLDSTVEDIDTESLRLQIPNPLVSVSRNGGTGLYAGIVLTLTCEVTVTGIPADMLSNIDVSATWTGQSGNELSNTGRITVTPAELDSGTTYISTVVIDTVRTSNNGMYTCQANINPSVSLTFIDASNSADVTTLDSQLPTLDLTAVSSTTRLPDVTPYNTFSLTCTATAPEGVVAPKTFTWRRAHPADDTCGDFSVVGGNVDSNLEQPVSTSVLKVTISETDIGVMRFCCQASIAGASGTSNSVLSIDVVGPTSPMQPTNVRVISTDATTATVQWTVPLIAYTPETYVVSYSTGSLTHQVLMSDPVESGPDFDAVNQMFSVELTGLEPNTAYNYQVISSNIVGTSTSETNTLTTTPAGSSSDSIGIVGGVLGALVALLLTYSVVATIVNVVQMLRSRRAKVSIEQPVYARVEQPVQWSAMAKLRGPDIKTSECVAYGQAQPPSTDRAEDTTYEVLGDEN